MGLTLGSDPFGPDRNGQFNFDGPDEVYFIRPLGRRVRGVVAGRTVIDSENTELVWATGSLPHYAFPSVDVTVDGTAEPSECPYKGTATHFRLRSAQPGTQPSSESQSADVAWTYGTGVRREARRVRNLISFYDNVVEILIDP